MISQTRSISTVKILSHQRVGVVAEPSSAVIIFHSLRSNMKIQHDCDVSRNLTDYKAI